MSSGEGHSGEPGGLVHGQGIKRVGSEDDLGGEEGTGVFVCVCVCAHACRLCLKGHTSLALVGMVCHPNSPGWPCLGSTAVCLLGGMSKVSTLTPINSLGPLPTPALLYQGKATHGRSFTSPEGDGNWEGVGPEK